MSGYNKNFVKISLLKIQILLSFFEVLYCNLREARGVFRSVEMTARSKFNRY